MAALGQELPSAAAPCSVDGSLTWFHSLRSNDAHGGWCLQESQQRHGRVGCSGRGADRARKDVVALQFERKRPDQFDAGGRDDLGYYGNAKLDFTFRGQRRNAVSFRPRELRLLSSISISYAI